MVRREPRRHRTEETLDRFLAECGELLNTAEQLPAGSRQRVEEKVKLLIRRFGNYLSVIDPVRQPSFVFDASNPDIIGRFIALALVVQPKTPLENLERFYGSGIYAIYYDGDFPIYRPIRGTETPIYVGKADPKLDHATTPKEQGERLSVRLRDHRRSINNAKNLQIAAFHYRSLVVQSGWQQAAEHHLIAQFKPIWNSETNICYGFGKHGDDPETRRNLRSPWDTIHPGRNWAHRDPDMTDAVALNELEMRISRHLRNTLIFRSSGDIVEAFLEGLRQH